MGFEERQFMRHQNNRWCWLVVSFVLLMLTSAAARATIFTDGTFVDADWTASKIVDTTAGQAATFAAGQVATGGNSGAYRRVAHTYDAGSIMVAHLRAGAVHDPSVDGAITSINFSYDLFHFNPPPSQAVAFGLLVLQNGTYY